MRKLQNTLAQLNENNFDILNNGSMEMLKGGSHNKNCYGGGKSKKSKKSKKGYYCGTKPKSVKSIKVRPSCYNPCGW